MNELRRNAPCPCGSGIKYKRCCRRRREPLDEVEIRPGCRVRVVTDWYEVSDPAALVRLLGRQPDVAGDSERGWSRADPQGGEGEHGASLAIDDEGRLEVSAASELAAETTRWWLERIAGELVIFEIGEVLAFEAEAWPDADAATGTGGDAGETPASRS